jgi:hypothetical protein
MAGPPHCGASMTSTRMTEANSKPPHASGVAPFAIWRLGDADLHDGKRPEEGCQKVYQP